MNSTQHLLFFEPIRKQNISYLCSLDLYCTTGREETHGVLTGRLSGGTGKSGFGPPRLRFLFNVGLDSGFAGSAAVAITCQFRSNDEIGFGEHTH